MSKIGSGIYLQSFWELECRAATGITDLSYFKANVSYKLNECSLFLSSPLRIGYSSEIT